MPDATAGFGPELKESEIEVLAYKVPAIIKNAICKHLPDTVPSGVGVECYARKPIFSEHMPSIVIEVKAVRTDKWDGEVAELIAQEIDDEVYLLLEARGLIQEGVDASCRILLHPGTYDDTSKAEVRLKQKEANDPSKLQKPLL